MRALDLGNLDFSCSKASSLALSNAGDLRRVKCLEYLAKLVTYLRCCITVMCARAKVPDNGNTPLLTVVQIQLPAPRDPHTHTERTTPPLLLLAPPIVWGMNL